MHLHTTTGCGLGTKIQPEIIQQAPIKQSILPEKLMKCVNHVHSVTKVITKHLLMK